ncbi:TetR family transcriptional regulator [Paraburkholderia caballeronis]|uniref:TetR/AcrR family transcriptional regulator n=1 Tax=Paraburkholderia caballeronis TaxID=416943 RepID=UPI0010665EE2|nr:TetR/AcrR family transcriptional regulator [Paraburkholderia caballeronis]TDV33832.1 TetR family transcriptional regulator [Paraburkholderia caballeronis]
MADRELTREDWLAIARQTLIEEGISSVRIERLANTLGVTRGGFYWRYRNLEELQAALVEDWRASNGRALFSILEQSKTLSDRFDEVIRIWLDEKSYSAPWDTAMREWGRVSPHVKAAVQAVDEERLAVLQAMFTDAGLAGDAALVRARILYYHQMGYYALDVYESRKRRQELMPFYKAALIGLDPEGLLALPSFANDSSRDAATSNRQGSAKVESS